MRILLDENVPSALTDALADYECLTAHDAGLASVKNGELLSHARTGFDAFVTLDRGIPHQHDHREHGLVIAVLRVPNSRVESVLSCVAVLHQFLQVARPGDIKEIRAPRTQSDS
jgi:hypothetical protein